MPRHQSFKILPKGDRLYHVEILPRGCEMTMSTKTCESISFCIYFHFFK